MNDELLNQNRHQVKDELLNQTRQQEDIQHRQDDEISLQPGQ